MANLDKKRADFEAAARRIPECCEFSYALAENGTYADSATDAAWLIWLEASSALTQQVVAGSIGQDETFLGMLLDYRCLPDKHATGTREAIIAYIDARPAAPVIREPTNEERHSDAVAKLMASAPSGIPRPAQSAAEWAKELAAALPDSDADAVPAVAPVCAEAVVRELVEAARPFLSGDVVDETSGTIPLMERLGLAIAAADIPAIPGTAQQMPVGEAAADAYKADQAERNSAAKGRLDSVAAQQQAGAVPDEVRAVIISYYEALSARQHGGVALDRAFKRIEHALGMNWDDWRAASMTKEG